MDKELTVEFTFLTADGEPSRTNVTTLTAEELADAIRILSKPSMFGRKGFTVRVLPK